MTHKEKDKKPPVWPVVGRLFQFAGRAHGWLYLARAFDLLLAAQLIIDRCHGQAIAQPVVDVGFRIVERQSTGGPPG